MEIADLVSTDLPDSIQIGKRPVRGTPLEQFLSRPLNKHDIDKLREQMASAAEDPEFPPVSIAELCRRLGCHQSYAARKFPELAEKIKSHRRTCLQIHKQQRLYFTGLVTKSIASQLAVSGQYPSSRKMTRSLPSSISLRDPAARKAWLEFLEEWGWKENQKKPATERSSGA